MLIYAIILLCLGIGLVVLEVLLPSGGLISILAIGAFIASLIMAFIVSTTAGFAAVATIIICLPITIALAFKLLPKTSFGKKMILSAPADTPAQRGVPGVSEEDYAPLIGKKGIAVTPLRPSGIASIDDKRYSVVSNAALLDKGTNIVVVSVQGNSIVVEAV